MEFIQSECVDYTILLFISYVNSEHVVCKVFPNHRNWMLFIISIFRIILNGMFLLSNWIVKSKYSSTHSVACLMFSIWHSSNQHTISKLNGFQLQKRFVSVYLEFRFVSFSLLISQTVIVLLLVIELNWSERGIKRAQHISNENNWTCFMERNKINGWRFILQDCLKYVYRQSLDTTLNPCDR